MGTIQEEPIQRKMGWDGTENQQENTCLILAATLKEFEASEILHPCKKELLHRTEKDNILLPRILDEAEIEESKKICENLTKKFNINKLLNKKPYELSGGEKQRVAICRALINNPQIILADEPTGNLDSNSSEVVMRTLESINGEMGKTILLVTHDPMIASFCKRIIFLKDGQVIENLKRADNKEMFYQEILKRMKNL